MATAVSTGGMWKSRLRSSGAIAPTAPAHHGPHKKPHRYTGMCIGDSIPPTCGICPVRNGRTRHSARHSADTVRRRSRLWDFDGTFVMFSSKIVEIFPRKRQKKIHLRRFWSEMYLRDTGLFCGIFALAVWRTSCTPDGDSIPYLWGFVKRDFQKRSLWEPVRINSKISISFCTR